MSTSLIKRVERNLRGRDFVVGDIHGCFEQLLDAMAAIGFNADGGDRLFCVGDLVDRGQESHEYQWWLNRSWFHSVRGNHDEMAIQYAAGNLDRALYEREGGLWNTIRTLAEQQATADAFSALPLAIEVETARGIVGIVHADVPPGWTWSQLVQSLHDTSPAVSNKVQEFLQWSRVRIDNADDSGVRGIRAVFCGHTPRPDPVVLGNVVYIDTGAYLGIAGRGNGGAYRFTIWTLDTLTPAIQVAA